MGSGGPRWAALAGAIAGDVLLPGSPAYEAARRPAVARFDGIRPLAVVRCLTDEDVAATISFARRAGLPTATRSGGHCFAGRSSTSGIVVDVTPMRSVALAGDVATVGAGARLGELYDALDAGGRTIPAGCGPSVGIAGLTLGGGLGILGRANGLTCDHLLAARVVLADGRVVDCDAHHDGDLFWALRGAGGGNFGVVTSLVLATLPAPAVATSFQLFWPASRAAAVIGAWQAWAPDAPDELAASLLLAADAAADRPAVVTVSGALTGTDADAAGLLDGLVARVGRDPSAAVRRQGSYRDTKRHLAEAGGEPAGGGHLFSKSEFFRAPLPDDAVASLVGHFLDGRVAGESRELDFTPWGGAYNRVPGDATAFAHRDARFLLKHAVVADPDPAAVAAARRWLARSWASTHPWGTGGVYPNFPDPDLAGWERAYHGANLERLVRVKARYDPDGFFRFPQSVPGHLPAPLTRAGGRGSTASAASGRRGRRR